MSLHGCTCVSALMLVSRVLLSQSIGNYARGIYRRERRQTFYEEKIFFLVNASTYMACIRSPNPPFRFVIVNNVRDAAPTMDDSHATLHGQLFDPRARGKKKCLETIRQGCVSTLCRHNARETRDLNKNPSWSSRGKSCMPTTCR